MESFNLQITLPESVTFESRGVEISFDLGAFAREFPTIVAHAVIHGLSQKVGDAGAGALAAAYADAHGDEAAKAADPATRKAWGKANPDAVSDMTRALMQKAADNLAKGEWNARGTGGTGDPLDTYRVQAMRRMIDPKGANGKALAAMETSGEQVRFILSLYRDAAPDVQATIDETATDLKAAADAAAAARKAAASAFTL